MKLEFVLVTPEKIVLESKQAQGVVIPSIEGCMTVYPQHMQMITELTSGLVELIEEDNRQSYFISGGFAHIQTDKLSLMTQIAVPFGKHKEIAQKIIENAQEDLKNLEKYPEKTEQRDETARYIEITKYFL